MRLHLASIGDSRWKYLDEEYTTPTGTLSVGDIVEKKNHNTMMIDIASSLSYDEFDEIKDYKTTFDMWNKLKDIYGGDDNVRRVKAESLRGQFDQMKTFPNMLKGSKQVLVQSELLEEKSKKKLL